MKFAVLDGDLLRLSNLIRDSIKPDVTMFVSYSTEEIKGKNVINFTVQNGTESPYYLTGKGLRPEGVYVRHPFLQLKVLFSWF